MTLNKNVLKNIGGEITDGILLNGDAQKIKVITGGEITCPQNFLPKKVNDIKVNIRLDFTSFVRLTS
jgi:hypothetical protein